MANIGNIFNVQDLETTIRKGSAEPVGHDKSAQVANMNITVDRGAARIHFDFAIFYRNYLFNMSGEGIIDSHGNVRNLSRELVGVTVTYPNKYSIIRLYGTSERSSLSSKIR